MILVQLDKVIFVLAALGVVNGAQQTPSPKPTAQGGTVIDPNGSTKLTNLDPNDPAYLMAQANMNPPSGAVMKFMDTLGLTKRARAPVAPIYIPKSLSDKSDEEIMNYVNMLKTQRRKLQNRMTRHMAYTGLLLAILQFFGSSSLVKGGTAGLFWLNNNYRATINADWMVHQQQLADFIVEYRRHKKQEGQTFPKSFIAGVPVIGMEYSKGKFVNFPIWTTSPGERLSADAEIRSPVQMVRNWALRK